MAGVWQRGRRLFTTSAILMLLTATAHTIGNLASSPSLPGEQAAIDSMKAFHEPLGFGMNPSLWDIYLSLAFFMTVTLTALGVLNLILAGSGKMPHSLLRRVGWFNVVWVAAFTALSAAYQVTPPLISGIVILIPQVIWLSTARADG